MKPRSFIQANIALLPHTLTLRVHPDTHEKLMIKALEVVRTGIGMPAFVGDKSYTAFFMRYGIPLEEAREYIDWRYAGRKTRA